jgi:2-haloacid dehalogenase
LSYAVGETGQTVSMEQTQELMKAYDFLDTFPDVKPAFKTIEDANDKINPVIFSNGTRDMVQTSLTKSPSLGAKENLFTKLVLIDEIPSEKRRYKPAMETYQFLVDSLESSLEYTWLVTANSFDVDGAKRFGLRVCWIDRRGTGWIDALGWEPDVICQGVDEAIGVIIEAQKASTN